VTHVFISYTRDDRQFVTVLEQKIAESGLAVWSDNLIRPGEQWRNQIDEAIQHAFAVVVVMTPAARTSEYVTYEWSFAMGLGVSIIPIMLERTEFHPKLAVLHFLDFTVRYGEPWGDLIARLKDVANNPLPTRILSIEVPSSPVSTPPNTDSVPELPLAEVIRGHLEALRAGDMEATKPLIEIGRMIFPELLQALLDQNSEVQNAVAYVFEQIGDPGIAYLLGMMSDESHPLARAAAIRGLSIIHEPSAVIGILHSLEDGDPRVKKEAETALRHMGSSAVPELLSALKAPEARLRHDATWMLGEILEAIILDKKTVVQGATLQRIANGLLRALHDENSDVRIMAANTLSSVGGTPVESAAIQELLQTLNDPNEDVVYATVYALGRIRSKTALTKLFDILSNRDSELRRIAIAAMGDIGDAEAVPHLLGVFADEGAGEEIRLTTAAALGAIRDRSAVPPLMGILSAEQGRLWETVVQALGKIGDEAAVSQLVEFLHDPDPGRSCLAARALGDIRSPSAVQPLMSLLNIHYKSSGGERVCDVAAEALLQIGTREAVTAVHQWEREHSS
jgi:HEAT repeat protein